MSVRNVACVQGFGQSIPKRWVIHTEGAALRCATKSTVVPTGPYVYMMVVITGIIQYLVLNISDAIFVLLFLLLLLTSH